jgi:hypothetical protein
MKVRVDGARELLVYICRVRSGHCARLGWAESVGHWTLVSSLTGGSN